MKRVVCEQLASLVCMNTPRKSDTRDVRVESNDANDVKHPDLTSAAAAAAGQSITQVERLVASINRKLETKLRCDTLLRRATERNQEMMNEWMIAAAVIDRICFIVFSIALVIGSFTFYIIFLSRP